MGEVGGEEKIKDSYTAMSPTSSSSDTIGGTTYTPITVTESCSPSSETCSPEVCSPMASPTKFPSTPECPGVLPVTTIGWNNNNTSIPGTSTSPPPFLSHSASSSFVPSNFTLLGHCNFDSKSNLSDTNSAILSICRICHMPEDENDSLISPCRCAGSLQYIHSTCLMRWLDICTRKSRKAPKCELCHYQYHRHKKFKLQQCRFPRVSQQDKILHVIFIVNLLIMVGCAVATVMCFLSDKGRVNSFPRNKASLTTEEIVTLSCGVLFFVSFFIAMSVQIKAKHTIYQLFVKFVMHNMEWEIDQYDKTKDSKLKSVDYKQSLAFV